MADRRAQAAARKAALAEQGSATEEALATPEPATEPAQDAPKPASAKEEPPKPEPVTEPSGKGKRVTVDLSAIHHRRLRGLALDLDRSGSDIMRAMLDGLTDDQITKLVNEWPKSESKPS